MAHKITKNLTWEEIRATLIQAVQPSLGTIAGLTQVQALRFEDDLEFTLSKVWKLVLAAYPGVEPGEANNHIFAYLLRLQLNMVRQFPPQPRNKTPFNQQSKNNWDDHRRLQIFY